MKPVVLCILDGFGHREAPEANAISLAHKTTLPRLFARYPFTTLACSGLEVGLPEGQMGNSEVGHTILGGGRVVYQDLPRISKAIRDGDFFANPELVATVEAVKARGGTLHVMGLTSPGGIHSTLEHGYAVVELARRQGLGRIAWHAFLDGRDTPPQSAAGYLEQVEAELARLGAGRVASLVGRFYAMDRDNRWDRVARSYAMLVRGEGLRAPATAGAAAAIRAAYGRGESDEFITPIVLCDGDQPIATVSDGDAVVFFNFRADRARELTAALTQQAFTGFDRGRRLELSRYLCMTQYDAKLNLPIAFAPQSLHNNLGEYLAGRGLAQFRSAETEKYAHVTFFFNGGTEAAYPHEDRRLVPSRRDIATYDLAPAMSATDVTDGVTAAIASGKYAFVLVNYANPDMVGHTGVLPAAIQAVETIDGCLGRLVEAATAAGASLLITADHGNCELMVDPETGGPHTAHTTNPVPFILVDEELRGRRLHPGGLKDVAPTILELMGLPRPAEMTGGSLLEPVGQG
ncbi:MAG TPA: 2,3-bisphosphoglycerate-independent phosphoglycerate mutase [Pseudomonadota bacterium]|nr:2,3-bisphosphoglycerate-independent phosphoglycerate mutase [Pseudomonadota bacterium]